MTYPVRRAIVVGGLVTIGALFGLFATTGIRARVFDAYVITLAAVLMLMLIRRVRALRPERFRSPFDTTLAAMHARAPQTGELAIERDVELSRVNAFHFHQRLRPVLREIASFRLRHGYGVDVAREPERARDVLPADLWEIVRPDAPAPADRLAPGPRIAELRAAVDALERL